MHTIQFFMSYLSCSLSCIASSFSIDMGKSSFNLKSSSNRCLTTSQQDNGGIFTFFIRDSLSVISHNPENKKSFFSAWVLLHAHCSNASAWPSNSALRLYLQNLCLCTSNSRLTEDPFATPNKMTISILSPFHPSYSLPTFHSII